MIAQYNTLSLALGAPGLIMQIAGMAIRQNASGTSINGRLAVTDPSMFNLGLLLGLVGTALLLTGLAYYAKAKGRSPWWCLFAFLSLIGLIVLACLKDQSSSSQLKPVKRSAPKREAPQKPVDPIGVKWTDQDDKILEDLHRQRKT